MSHHTDDESRERPIQEGKANCESREVWSAIAFDWVAKLVDDDHADGSVDNDAPVCEESMVLASEDDLRASRRRVEADDLGARDSLVEQLIQDEKNKDDDDDDNDTSRERLSVVAFGPVPKLAEDNDAVRPRANPRGEHDFGLQGRFLRVVAAALGRDGRPRRAGFPRNAGLPPRTADQGRDGISHTIKEHFVLSSNPSLALSLSVGRDVCADLAQSPDIPISGRAMQVRPGRRATRSRRTGSTPVAVVLSNGNGGVEAREGASPAGAPPR